MNSQELEYRFCGTLIGYHHPEVEHLVPFKVQGAAGDEAAYDNGTMQIVGRVFKTIGSTEGSALTVPLSECQLALPEPGYYRVPKKRGQPFESAVYFSSVPDRQHKRGLRDRNTHLKWVGLLNQHRVGGRLTDRHRALWSLYANLRTPQAGAIAIAREGRGVGVISRNIAMLPNPYMNLQDHPIIKVNDIMVGMMDGQVVRVDPSMGDYLELIQEHLPAEISGENIIDQLIQTGNEGVNQEPVEPNGHVPGERVEDWFGPHPAIGLWPNDPADMDEDFIHPSQVNRLQLEHPDVSYAQALEYLLRRARGLIRHWNEPGLERNQDDPVPADGHPRFRDNIAWRQVIVDDIFDLGDEQMEDEE